MSNFTSQFQSLLIKVRVFLAQLQMRISSLGKGSDKNSQSTTTAVNAVIPEISTPKFDRTLPTPLQQKVKAELQEAWSFIQDPLVPTLLTFVTKVVEKIDPPLNMIATKVASVPTVNKSWQNLQTNLQATSQWKKTSIALAPIGRSLSEFLKPITTSASLKPILAKPLGTFAFVLILSLLLSLKPHPVNSVAVNQPGSNRISEIIPPEAGDVPISPDRVLISSIQAQVTDISKSYGAALIASVQTNFKLGRLIVQLSDAWYQLNPELQEQLVTDLEKRSQALSFKKLFLLDTEQHILARTSAVMTGTDSEMIILRR